MALCRAARTLTTSTIGEPLERRLQLSSFQQAWKDRGREEAVVVTDDGNTIVCWHPEPQVPYEMTKPLPQTTQESDSILKVQYNKEMKHLFQKKHPFFINKDLRELTFTTKHRWFPRPEKRFAKRNPPRDREYL
ncbi:39S ribosomal protein L42-like [Homarus americanus]|uniref:Large ribosomal subunit protein mL42 n=1 Tax=Homarus americanus TaxID=6706 RepID=A0A8J5MJT9_HOMAM|nr:39S ribosomal protein L42-like [Homarus americanus]